MLLRTPKVLLDAPSDRSCAMLVVWNVLEGTTSVRWGSISSAPPINRGADWSSCWSPAASRSSSSCGGELDRKT